LDFIQKEAAGNSPPDPRWRGHPKASTAATTPLNKTRWNVVQDIWPLTTTTGPAGPVRNSREFLVVDSQREDETHVLRLLAEDVVAGGGAANKSTVTDLLRLRTKEGVYFTSSGGHRVEVEVRAGCVRPVAPVRFLTTWLHHIGCETRRREAQTHPLA
jgi:hypothetical protein